MILVGVKGHAKDIITDQSFLNQSGKLYMFDDVTTKLPDVLFDKFQLLRSIDEALISTPEDSFMIALGAPRQRKMLYEKFVAHGFSPKSFLASGSLVDATSKLGRGLNVMPFSGIFTDTIIGNGCLINSYASVHHDVQLGDFVTISPGARILGRASIGSLTEIGANAVILPDIIVGSGVIVGAGAVVTKSLPDDCTAVGVPAKIIK